MTERHAHGQWTRPSWTHQTRSRPGLRRCRGSGLGQDCSERFRIGHEPATGSGERPFGRNRGSSGIDVLMLERRLLSKQRNDFDYVIHRYCRALGFGRFGCGRFFGRIRVLEAELFRGRGAGFWAFKARLRATARATTCASCCR